MFDAILRFVMGQKALVLLFAVLLLSGGLLAWRQLPIDAFPDVTNVQVTIITNAPGLTPAEVERLITFPIETEMGGLPGVNQVRSVSKSGLSLVIIRFEDDVDTYFSRQLVFERLAQAREELPPGIEPELGPVSTGLGEIYQYSLQVGFYCPQHPQEWSKSAGNCPVCATPRVASTADLMELRNLQDWLISPQLRRLHGVNEVNSFGGLVKQFHVIPDPAKLQKYQVSLDEITTALAANNSNVGGGYIVKDWEQVNVVSQGLLRGITDIEQIVLRSDDGTPVFLRDVATVQLGAQTRNGVVTMNGEGESVIGMAIMLKGANSKEVVDRVKGEMPDVQKTLPPGVKIQPFYDRTDLIQACIGTIRSAMFQGIILVLLVLFLVLWDIRAACTVAASLPVMLATALLLMGWGGVTANLMSLGGLAIAVGMIADSAIVFTENIARHMREKASSGLTRTEIAMAATQEVMRPVIFSVLIILIVFLPLFTLESLEGKMFKPLALTLCFAMIGSIVVSATVVPVLAALWVKRIPTGERENILLRLIHGLYQPILQLAMKGRWMTIGVAAAVMGATLALLPQIGMEFLPAMDEGALAINLVRLPTASGEGSALQCTAIERRLRATFPEITDAISKTGRAEIAEDPMGPEQSDLFLMLKPAAQWRPGMTRDKLVAEIAIELAAFPGIRASFSQPIALRVNELISGIKSDVAIKIIGDDMELLRVIGEKIAPLLAAVQGAEDVKIEQVSGLAQLQVELRRDRLARHKINVEDVNRLIETAIGGTVATTLYDGQKRYDVLVRFPDNARDRESALRRLLVPAPGGYQVPLDELATLSEVEVPAQISREDARRRLLVECNVRNRDLGGFVAEAQRAVATVEKEIPQGYRIVWGGQFENQQRAMARLAWVVPLSLLLIFLLLFISLRTIKSAVMVFANLPFALVGGIAAIFVLRLNLSVSAIIGFIALFGLAVQNGLVLVSFFDQLRGEGMTTRAAVLDACRLRVRPLVMTTMTTVLGLLPILISSGPGADMQKPLVAVMFGGLISSLTLTLVILPVLYTLLNHDGPPPGRPLPEAAI